MYIYQVLQSDLVWTHKSWPFQGLKKGDLPFGESKGHFEEAGVNTVDI